MNNESCPLLEWPSWTEQEYCQDGSRSPASLSNALAEVEETSKLIHDNVEETAELIHQPLWTLTDNLLTDLVLQKLLHQLFDCIRQVMAVDTVTVLLQTKDRQQLAVRATLGLEEEIEQGIQIPIGRGFAGLIAVRNELTFVDDLSTVEIVSPILRNKKIRSMLGVPLLVKDRAVGLFHGGTVHRTIGVFHVGTIRPRQFARTDGALLQFIAEGIGRAIDRLQISNPYLAKGLEPAR